MVDGISGVPQHIDVLQSRGFFVGKSYQDGIATLSLNVTATMDKNGTVVSCSSVKFRTDNAVLVVIAGKSLSSLVLVITYRDKSPLFELSTRRPNF